MYLAFERTAGRHHSIGEVSCHKFYVVLLLLSAVLHLAWIIPRILITKTSTGRMTDGWEITVEQTNQVEGWCSILPEYVCKFITEQHPCFEFDKFVIHLINNIHHAMKMSQSRFDWIPNSITKSKKQQGYASRQRRTMRPTSAGELGNTNDALSSLT